MKQCRCRVGSTHADKGSFGRFEQGNKIYYKELDSYFASNPVFIEKDKKFIRDIVPEFKVRAG